MSFLARECGLQAAISRAIAHSQNNPIIATSRGHQVSALKSCAGLQSIRLVPFTGRCFVARRIHRRAGIIGLIFKRAKSAHPSLKLTHMRQCR